MIVVAFASFAVLVIAWFFIPSPGTADCDKSSD